MTTTITESLLATDVAASLEAAKTRNALLKASQQIQHVQDLSQRERLGAIFRKRYDEFKSSKSHTTI